MSTIIFTFGARGFGYTPGLIPEVRFGLGSVAWCRGTLMEKMDDIQRQLGEILRRMSGDAR
jgi:hypothetical protein